MICSSAVSLQLVGGDELVGRGLVHQMAATYSHASKLAVSDHLIDGLWLMHAENLRRLVAADSILRHMGFRWFRIHLQAPCYA